MKLIYWLTAAAFIGCLFSLYAFLDELEKIIDRQEQRSASDLKELGL